MNLIPAVVCACAAVDRILYTIRAVPMTDVRSIRRHTPALGWQYIIVVLATGKTTPHLIVTVVYS